MWMDPQTSRPSDSPVPIFQSLSAPRKPRIDDPSAMNPGEPKPRRPPSGDRSLASPPSPSRPLSPSSYSSTESTEDPVAEGDEDDQAADDLLEEFYSFTYEKAVLVGPTGTSPTKAKAANKSKSGNGSPTREAIGLQKKPTAAGPSAASLPTLTGALTREIMDALLPPKTWQDAQGKWQRMVSMLPATRTDAQQLQETFDQLLEQQQARAQAICPVREKFFLQVYEELIREVACECPERGLLLLRMRDELRLTIEAYQTLYHNSIAYGRQKAVQAEGGVGELEGEIQGLEAEREQLIATKRELTLKVRFLEEQRSEEEKMRELRHAHTVQYLQTQRQELEVFRREMTQDPTWK